MFCILLATFLWLERLRADQIGVGLACVLGATIAGGFVAPHLDGSSPWLDYEQIAEDLQPERAATFSWDHNYGPMTWPRDGREVLRIKAARQTYWKAVNLDEFDGAALDRLGPDPHRDRHGAQRTASGSRRSRSSTAASAAACSSAPAT